VAGVEGDAGADEQDDQQGILELIQKES